MIDPALHRAKALGPTALYIYVTLMDLAGDRDRAYTTNAELAALCDVETRTIQRTLPKLIEEGLIACPSKGNGRGLKSVYVIVRESVKGDMEAPKPLPVVPQVDPEVDLAWLIEQPEIIAVSAQYKMTRPLVERSLKVLIGKWQGYDRGGEPNRPATSRARVQRAVNWLREGERTQRHTAWRKEAPYEMAGVLPV